MLPSKTNGINCWWSFPPLLLTLNSEKKVTDFSGILKTHRNFLRSFLEAPKIGNKKTPWFLAGFLICPDSFRLSDLENHQLTTPWFLRSRNALIFEASSPANDWGLAASLKQTASEKPVFSLKNKPPPKKRKATSIFRQYQCSGRFRLVSGRVFTSAKLRNLWNLFYK